MNFDGKVALVTGASRGIGQAIALELGKQGAVVIGTSTTQSGADGIQQQLAAAGVKGAGMVLNVNDAQANRVSRRRDTKTVRRHRDSRQQRRHHARQPAGAHEGRGVG